MPKIITIVTKFEDGEWKMVSKNLMLTTSESDILTPEDVSDYLEPVRLLYLSLPGILPEQQQVINQGSNTLVLSTEFDTLGNAQAAYDLLYGENPPTEVVAFRNLIKSEKYRDKITPKSIITRVVP